MESWPTIVNAIPQEVIEAATALPALTEGMYVAFTPTGSTPDFYARRETASDGSPRYHVM